MKVALGVWNRLPRLACRAKRLSELEPVQFVLRPEKEGLEIGRAQGWQAPQFLFL